MSAPNRARTVFRWAGILVFVTVLLGTMVCATDSSSSCPAWPACYPDQVGPALQRSLLENPAIEFVHRAISFAALVLLAVAGVLGRRHHDPRVRVLPWVALACALGSAVFGMMIILFTLPLALGLLDLAFALIAMTLISIAAAALGDEGASDAPRGLRPLAWTAFGLLLVMHLVGSVVAGVTSDGTASFTRCLSWPLWTLHDIDRFPAMQGVRMGMAVVAIGLLIVVTILAGRLPATRAAASTLAVALVVEVALGALITASGLAPTQTNGINLVVAIAYGAAAVTVLWSLGLILGGAHPATAEPERPRRAAR